MKVALVHDYLNQFGGAERVLWAIHEIFPEAPIYTSIFDPLKLPPEFRKLEVVTSSIQKMPFVSLFTKHYTFIYPLVFESFDFSEYDVVISSTASFAKGVLVKPETLHICYCHTPPRFLYHYATEVNRRKIWYLAPFLALFDNYFRIWDFNAAQRVDYFVANSRHTASRISKFYRREARVIYPPVEVAKSTQLNVKSQAYFREKTQDFSPEMPARDGSAFGGKTLNLFLEKRRKPRALALEGRHFLIVSRLAQYKRIDLAILACNKLNLNLKIIGTGRDEKRLKRMAGKTIEFLGFVEDKQVADYFLDCQAFLFPGEDDFGITPIEAMSYGKPVLALGKGGVLESIIPGKTGEFFAEETVEALAKTIQNFKPDRYRAEDCIKQAQKFSKDNFKKNFSKFVNEKWDEFCQK